MEACPAALVHSAEVRHNNTTELSILYRLAGTVRDFDQNVTLGNMIVPRGFGTGDGEQGKF